MPLTAAEVWRDYVTDGVPASGFQKPNKREIRELQERLESSVGQVGLGFSSLALLDADLAHAANTLALVYADATPANNGIYLKSGVSGAGSWARVGDTPTELIRLTVTGGTANAIQASASETPSVPGSKLYLLVPTSNNTGAVTLALNGGTATPIKDAFGSNLVSGSLIAGTQYLLGYLVDHYQALISQPVDASGILTDAISARDVAQTASADAIAAALGANAIYQSRTAFAAATVIAGVKAAVCLGYAAEGDCSPILFKRVAAQPTYGGVRSADTFMPDGSTDASNGGWWVYVPGSSGVDAQAFGYKADWNGTDAGATDSATALQNAICFASLGFGTGFDTGGGGGGDVLLPRGTGMVGSKVIVHDGVRVLGKGTYGTVLKMKDTFSTSDHFFRLGTPGDVASVVASQTKASAGDLTINGTNASGGVATFLQKRVVSIYSAGNDSARTFTVYGTDKDGASVNEAVTGANAGHVDTNTYFLTVTRVAVDGATASTVTVGYQTRAAFGSRLEGIQLFSSLTNAESGKAMVYTDNAQHTAGVKDIKIFGGNRHCAFFEIGYGGASYFTCDDVETFNHGNSPGVSSNNSQIKLNYAGLLTNIRNVVMGGPGATGGASAKGIEILGGNVIGENIHSEGIADGIVIAIPTENDGTAQLKNINGNPSTTNLIHIDSVTDNNTVVLSSIFGNGSTVTIKDDPGAATVTGNVIPWTTY